MDKFWENYITTRPVDSKGAFDAFKQMHQDPRPMAQGSRNTYSQGQLVTPSVDGSRPGYKGPESNYTAKDINKIVKQYDNYLLGEIKGGDLAEGQTFKKWLNKNRPKDASNIYNFMNRENIKPLINKPLNIFDAKVKVLDTYVTRANEQGMFIDQKKLLKTVDISAKTGDVTGEYRTNINNVLKKLDTQEIKVHKAFNKLINNELVFVTDPDFYTKFPTEKLAEPGSINRMIIQETGLGSATLRKYRSTFKKPGSNVPYFSTKKGKQQLDIIKHMNLKMGKVGEKTFDGFSFNDLMEYGANSKKGKMYFKTATGSDFYKDANNVVRDFAVKNFDNNAKWGNDSKIKFYKKGSDTPIKWQPGKRITADFDFTYKGKRYGSKDLAQEYLNWTKGKSTPFKEVYDNHKAYTNFLRRSVVVDGQKTSIGKLFKDAGHMGMAIDHNTLGGVGEEPFKNLRLLSSRANSELGNILQYYKKSPKIQKLLANEFTKHLPVNENYINALANDEIKIAKDMLKHGNSTIPMTYNQAAKNILTTKNIKNFSPNELLTVSKSAYGSEVGYNIFKGLKPEVFEGVKTKTQLSKILQNIAKKKGLNITNKEAGFIATDMLKDFGKMGLKGGRLLKALQLEFEPIFEGLFYQYAKKYKGYDHGLAREELFLPKMIAKIAPDLWEKVGFKPFKTGVWEGADPLIEKQLREYGGGEYIDRTNKVNAEVDKYHTLENELGMMQVSYGDYTAASPEKIKAKEKEIENQRNLLIDLEHTLKPGTPAHDAYMIAKEKQDYEFRKNISESAKRKEKRLHDEYLEYRGGKQRSFLLPKEEGKKRVKDPLFKTPYTFLETDDTFFDILEPGKKAWEEYGLTDTQVGPVIKEGIKDKWKQIYDMGGIDLMDKIGIAGGVANMAGGGMVGIRKPNALPPTGGPQSGGLPSLYNNVRKW